MIDIGTTDFLINVPSLPRDQFESYSSNLFDIWDKRVEQSLILPDYSISLEVEEGSVKGVGRIATVLGALYLGIGNYGSFISGLQTIRGQVISVSNSLVENATLPFSNGSGSINAKVKKRGGALTQLQRLFNKVQRGEMTPEQAMQEAELLFAEESASSPEFMNGLKSSLETAPRFPQQILLPYDIFEDENGFSSKDKSRPSRPSNQQPTLPIQQYRIEIWRASKKDKKNIKVTEL